MSFAFGFIVGAAIGVVVSTVIEYVVWKRCFGGRLPTHDPEADGYRL